MLAAVFALMLQQAASGQVVWSETPPPAPPPAAVAPAANPVLPAWARADPFGYERSECSPVIRKTSETLEACQARVRVELSADLGDTLPDALRPAGAPDSCRQEAAGAGYAVQCGAPSRAAAPTAPMVEQTCETRPQVQSRGGVAWSQDCRPASGAAPADDGLKIRIGGRD